MENISIHLFCW